jgi:hypothetical protein
MRRSRISKAPSGSESGVAVSVFCGVSVRSRASSLTVWADEGSRAARSAGASRNMEDLLSGQVRISGIRGWACLGGGGSNLVAERMMEVGECAEGVVDVEIGEDGELRSGQNCSSRAALMHVMLA